MTGDGVNDAPALQPRRHRRRDGRQRHRGRQGGGRPDPGRRRLRLDRRRGRGRAGGLRQHPALRRLPLLQQRRRAGAVPGLGDLGRRRAAAAGRDAGAGDRPRHRPAAGDGARHRAARGGDDDAAAAPRARSACSTAPRSPASSAAIGPLAALAAMASFLFAYWLAGWRPWDPLADEGPLYLRGDDDDDGRDRDGPGRRRHRLAHQPALAARRSASSPTACCWSGSRSRWR